MRNNDEAFDAEQHKAEQFWKDMYCNDGIAKKNIDMNKVGFVTPYLDDVKGKNVLDVGCGRGDLSVLLATYGAYVTAFDMIQDAVNTTNSFADSKKADIESAGGSVKALCMNASDIDMFDKDSFDYAFGSMILHHIEPLDDFADKLAKIVKIGGGISL